MGPKSELEQKASCACARAVLPSHALLGDRAINTASAGPPNYPGRPPRAVRPRPRKFLARPAAHPKPDLNIG
ncbi:unnamed protein product [Pieris brassicae]|uniref:Uncharacterized protein n=1 Tax=Pieris brassicae TaxID=7116 RepID=A0A9P0T5J2_PIEBR|nr:unnamed protein product [Pieris brassicae]